MCIPVCCSLLQFGWSSDRVNCQECRSNPRYPGSSFCLWGFHTWGYPNSWMVMENSKKRWMIWGYFHFRRPLYNYIYILYYIYIYIYNIHILYIIYIYIVFFIQLWPWPWHCGISFRKMASPSRHVWLALRLQVCRYLLNSKCLVCAGLSGAALKAAVDAGRHPIEAGCSSQSFWCLQILLVPSSFNVWDSDWILIYRYPLII